MGHRVKKVPHFRIIQLPGAFVFVEATKVTHIGAYAEGVTFFSATRPDGALSGWRVNGGWDARESV